MHYKVTLAFLLGTALPLLAQTEHASSISNFTNSNRETVFKSNATALKPQLRRLSMTNRNAPTPFIKHFWEFDDGTFTTKEEAAHAYAARGNRSVNVTMTPCYTLDKISSSAKTVQVDKSTSMPKELNDESFGALRLTSNLVLHNIKNIRANEQFISIVSYRNMTGGDKNAKLYVFFNKKGQVNAAGRVLNIKDARLHGATEGVLGQDVSDINKMKNEYYDAKIFKINNLNKFSKNLFLTFNVESKAGFEKMKELDIAAALVIEGSSQVEKAVLSFEPSSSFDPNNMKAPRNVSFRFFPNKPLKYRINFENLGNAPAQSLNIQANIPDALDAYSVQNIKTSHAFQSISQKDSAMKYTISPDGKIITFDFKNIIINGSEETWDPKRKDTQGYVEYELKPKKDVKKRPLTSKASIIFDNNTPIPTDPMTTFFKTGISLGAKAGVNYHPDTKSANYFIGATYSAYRPAQPYLQIELMVDINRNASDSDTATRYVTKLPISSDETRFGYYIKDSLHFNERFSASNAIRIVPASVRYDLSNYLGFGLGVYADIAFTQQQSFVTPIVSSYYSDPNKRVYYDECIHSRKMTSDNSSTRIDYGLLADMTLGKYSNGLALGLRYMQPLNKEKSTEGNLAFVVQSKTPKPFFQLYLSYKIL
jgi:PKD repeat protein